MDGDGEAGQVRPHQGLQGLLPFLSLGGLQNFTVARVIFPLLLLMLLVVSQDFGEIGLQEELQYGRG